MSITTTGYRSEQEFNTTDQHRLGSYLSLASTMTLDDLRRETWRLWDCEPSGEPSRRQSLRLELVELQLDLDRLSLRLADRTDSPEALALEMHAQHLMDLRQEWRRDAATNLEEAA